MTLPCIEIQTSPSPQASIIWLHGLGADGNDFAPIVPQLDLGGVLPIRFVFPNAPSIPVTINQGYVMPAWYDILGTELNRHEDEAGLRRSQLHIEALIARELVRGIPASRIVLAGFSQGCAMTLMTGLRHPQRLAGLMALSGYLPLADKTSAERTMINADVPILMVHGRLDPVIQIERARDSAAALTAMGYPLTWREYPMPHSVCPEELVDISHWLRLVLPS